MVTAAVKWYPTFFWSKMQELDLHDMWFQQDCATCHTGRVNMGLLIGDFGKHVISCSRPVNYSPRWCDITPLHYFGGAISRLMPIHTSPHQLTEDNIEAFIREIPAEMLERVCQNCTKRSHHLKRSLSQHLHEIIFNR